MNRPTSANTPATVSNPDRPLQDTPHREELIRLGPWFHNLHLDDGTQTRFGSEQDTKLGDFPRWKWDGLKDHLPADLAGARVLDIGCNAGFYSFELAKRGADVLGIDHDPRYLDQARWAADHIDTGTGRVTFEPGDAYGLLHDTRTFDLIVFMGVLYHLRYPMLALDAVSARLEPGGSLLFQTLTMPGPLPGPEHEAHAADMPLNEREPMLDTAYPKLAFIEHRWAGDPTNWFAANPAACEAMLRSTGLTELRKLADEAWLAKKPQRSADPPMGYLPEALFDRG